MVIIQKFSRLLTEQLHCGTIFTSDKENAATGKSNGELPLQRERRALLKAPQGALREEHPRAAAANVFNY